MKLAILVTLLSFACLAAQSLSDTEQKMMTLESRERKQNLKIDSLKKDLEKSLERIDKKKSEKGNDEKEIANMMSGAFDISRKIETEQAVLKEISSHVRNIKLTIHNIYTQKIDSLQKKLDKTNRDIEKKKIEQEIFKLFEKRLLILPVITHLRFDPGKIRDIHIQNASDEIEESILEDYLTQALAEIDSHLVEIRQRRADMDEMKRLEAKAEIFMADAQDSRIFELYTQSSSNLTTRTSEATDFQYDYSTGGHVDAFRAMILQLYEVGPEIGISNRNKLVFPDKINLSDDQYFELVKTTQNYLELYRKLILKKLGRR